jgi:hypothetical protein
VQYDVSDTDHIFDLLGNAGGIAELAKFSKTVGPPIQRDIVSALLKHDQLEYEPVAISLLIDASAQAWKRANAAYALAEHGTERMRHYPISGRLHQNWPQLTIRSRCMFGHCGLPSASEIA